MKRLLILPLIGAAAAAGTRELLRRRSGGGEAADPEQPEQRWTCECGAEYRVVGTGRHQLYWPVGGAQDEAVMGDECPACGRALAA